MDFTRQEIEELTKNILKDIQKKVGKEEVKKPTINKTNWGDKQPSIASLKEESLKKKKGFEQLIDITPKKSKNSIDKVLEANNIKS